ncbi:hypothetical protein SDJN02_22302, partial [Cucurbita argyrosperma subsp. argyrosperma]
MCYESNGGDRTWEEGFWWAYLTLFSHQRDVRIRVRVRERLIEGMEWVEVQEVNIQFALLLSQSTLVTNDIPRFQVWLQSEQEFGKPLHQNLER